MFKNFLLKKMLKAQGVPEEQIDMFLKMMEKDPELFKKIALEVEERVKKGEEKESAGLAVMQKYQDDLRKLM